MVCAIFTLSLHDALTISDILKNLHVKISKSIFYQSLHVSELDIPTPLMNNLLDESIAYLSDFLQQETIDFFYDEFTKIGRAHVITPVKFRSRMPHSS